MVSALPHNVKKRRERNRIVPKSSRCRFPYDSHSHTSHFLKKCFIFVILMTISFITSIYHGRKAAAENGLRKI